jgi:hypothetical protein
MDKNQSSNSSATLLGRYNFGFYENSTQLTGSHFKDPVLVSAIVVNGICVFSFAALAIVSWWMKGKRARGRKVFAVFYGLLVALFLLVFLTLNPINYSFNCFSEGMTSVVVYTGLVVVGFENDWDVKINPGLVDNIGPDRVENVIQQFDNVGKLFS